MPIPGPLLAELRQIGREPSHWFSIDEIRKRDNTLEAAQYIQKTTGKQFIVQRNSDDLYRRLEDWASRLLMQEVRLFEHQIWVALSAYSVVPTEEDDEALRDIPIDFMETSVTGLREIIAEFCKYAPDKSYEASFELSRATQSLRDELSTTIPLAGELSRLEMMDSGHIALDTIGHGQIRIDRFFERNFSTILHPFDPKTQKDLASDRFKEAIRLLTYVVYKDVEEVRLVGFRDKFVSVFLRYLSCSRESSSPVVEQISTLVEPFLKKLSFLFNLNDADGNPLWHCGLNPLFSGLKLSAADLRKSDAAYWQARTVEDAVFRFAYQLRHKAAHEAHEYAYYERERHAYYVFAAILLSCHVLVQSMPELKDAVDIQENVDEVRDLFVRIDELTFGPDGSRLDSTRSVALTRLEKLLHSSSRAQVVWPNCSAKLRDLLENEYLAVKSELVEADREADLEAYFESMREEEYW